MGWFEKSSYSWSQEQEQYRIAHMQLFSILTWSGNGCMVVSQRKWWRNIFFSSCIEEGGLWKIYLETNNSGILQQFSSFPSRWITFQYTHRHIWPSNRIALIFWDSITPYFIHNADDKTWKIPILVHPCCWGSAQYLGWHFQMPQPWQHSMAQRWSQRSGGCPREGYTVM